MRSHHSFLPASRSAPAFISASVRDFQRDRSFCCQKSSHAEFRSPSLSQRTPLSSTHPHSGNPISTSKVSFISDPRSYSHIRTFSSRDKPIMGETGPEGEQHQSALQSRNFELDNCALPQMLALSNLGRDVIRLPGCALLYLCSWDFFSSLTVTNCTINKASKSLTSSLIP